MLSFVQCMRSCCPKSHRGTITSSAAFCVKWKRRREKKNWKLRFESANRTMCIVSDSHMNCDSARSTHNAWATMKCRRFHLATVPPCLSQETHIYLHAADRDRFKWIAISMQCLRRPCAVVHICEYAHTQTPIYYVFSFDIFVLFPYIGSHSPPPTTTTYDSVTKCNHCRWPNSAKFRRNGNFNEKRMNPKLMKVARVHCFIVLVHPLKWVCTQRSTLGAELAPAPIQGIPAPLASLLTSSSSGAKYLRYIATPPWALFFIYTSLHSCSSARTSCTYRVIL